MGKEYPCLTPLLTRKKSENTDLHLTHIDWLQYHWTSTLMIHLGTPSLSSFEKSFVKSFRKEGRKELVLFDRIHNTEYTSV